MFARHFQVVRGTAAALLVSLFLLIAPTARAQTNTWTNAAGGNDPKVTVIWGIIREFFEENRCPIDVRYYASYELMVDALMRAELDVAWNSPLAWLAYN